MDLAALDRLGRLGLVAFPGSQLTDVANWAKDWCVATGDARFCIVGDLLAEVDAWRTRFDEAGGVPTAVLGVIDEEVTTQLPAVLEQQDPSDASNLAAALRDAVAPLLTDPSRWPRDEGTD